MIGRLFILLVAVVGVGLYFPGSRAFMVDWSQPVLEPGKRWMPRQELRQIATDLDQYIAGRGPLPFQGESSTRGSTDVIPKPGLGSTHGILATRRR